MKLRKMIMTGILTVLLAGLLSVPSFADGSCTVTAAKDVETVTVTRGSSGQVSLNELFTDSEGHALSYAVDDAEESLKARISGNKLLLDPLAIGEFIVKITASCSEGTEAQLSLPVSVVASEDEGNPAQYGYDETPADAVRCCVTISSDGIPLVGNDSDNTILSRLEVTVPYFDLALYGLEANYRYHTENGRGQYIDDEVVERPTAMHLIIYLTERYYMGLPEEECCKGTSGILDYSEPVTMKNLLGATAYEGKLSAYYLTGNATSTYMASLWGHDENLMYYRNHYFPLMDPGWGATSDYMLLSDGDTLDIAMYTDWDFYHEGSFCCFDEDVYEIAAGETLRFSTVKASTSDFGSGELTPVTGILPAVYDENWIKIDDVESETTDYRYAFEQPGTYYLLGLDEKAGTEHANKAPAVAIVEVRDPSVGERIQSMVLSATELEYTGKELRPEITSINGKTDLKEGTDYTVKWPGSSVKPGKYTVTVNGCGSFWGHVNATYVIKQTKEPEILTSIELTQNEFVFNDKNQRPSVKTLNGSDKLKENTDYTVQWPEASVQPGTYTVTVTGKGDYTGCVTAAYTIKPAPERTKLSSLELSAYEFAWNGQTQRPEIGKINGRGDLVEGTDYEVTWPSESKEAGEYTVTVTGIGDYEGTVTATYKILASKEPEPIMKVELAKTKFCYNGKDQKPEIRLVNDAPLAEGVDYQVIRPKESVHTGTYTVKVVGIGDYCGEQTVSYTIAPLALSRIRLSKTAFVFSGKAQLPTVSVTDEEGKAVPNTGFVTLWPKNPVNAGTYTVKVTGKGDYSGTLTSRFVISKAKNTLAVKPVKKTIKAKKTVKIAIAAKGGAKISWKVSKGKPFVKLIKKGKKYYVQGLKRGKAVITVTAAATANYKKATKQIVITVK